MVRVASGVILAAVFFALIWFTNATVLLAVALVIAALAVHEYINLFRTVGINVPFAPTLVATLAAAVSVAIPRIHTVVVLPISVVVIAIWVMVSVARGARRKPGPPAPDPPFTLATTAILAGAFSTVYIGVSLGTLVAIHLRGGREAVILLMATIAVSDTAQYYSGRTFGRRPLAPALSPKKTIEGAIGGFVLAPIFLVLAARFLMPAATSYALVAAVGVALVIAGIAGDLFESMLKRAAGVKDSSALIPGHGGVLDRIDALLFASPTFYLFIGGLIA